MVAEASPEVSMSSASGGRSSGGVLLGAGAPSNLWEVHVLLTENRR